MSDPKVAKYQVIKTTPLQIENKGVANLIAEYYQKWASGVPVPRFLPSKLQKITVQLNDLVDVEFGERTVLNLGCKILQVKWSLPGETPVRKDYRTLTCLPVKLTIKQPTIGNFIYEGEMIVYDEGYGCIASETRSLRPLNDLAKQIGGTQLVATS